MRTSCDYGTVRTASNDGTRVVNVVVDGKVNGFRGPNESCRKEDLRRRPRTGPVHRGDGGTGQEWAWWKEVLIVRGVGDGRLGTLLNDDTNVEVDLADDDVGRQGDVVDTKQGAIDGDVEAALVQEEQGEELLEIDGEEDVHVADRPYCAYA